MLCSKVYFRDVQNFRYFFMCSLLGRSFKFEDFMLLNINTALKFLPFGILTSAMSYQNLIITMT